MRTKTSSICSGGRLADNHSAAVGDSLNRPGESGAVHLAGLVAVRVLAWVLVGAAVVFALLWLREIVPDLLAGRPSTSAAAWQVPTNPVHVLDLALFLPAIFVAGVLILRGDPMGVGIGVPGLVWMILTCLPILLTPVMSGIRGHDPAWGAVPPVAVLLVVFLISGGLLLRTALSSSQTG